MEDIQNKIIENENAERNVNNSITLDYRHETESAEYEEGSVNDVNIQPNENNIIVDANNNMVEENNNNVGNVNTTDNDN